jgi:hypothetical protein
MTSADPCFHGKPTARSDCQAVNLMDMVNRRNGKFSISVGGASGQQ